MTAFFRPAILRDTMIARGASREEAERLSEALSAAFGEDVATRQDLEGFKNELRTEIVAVRHDLDIAKAELRSEIQTVGVQLRSDMQAQGAQLRSDMQAQGAQFRSDMQSLGTQFRDEVRAVKLWVAFGALGFIATAINLGMGFWRGFR